jgi:hypothetical protein
MPDNDSPYLADPTRLPDVIAAIQTLGSYKFYKLDFATWADRISADREKAPHWKGVFEQHPEFFRLDTEKKKASLVWRRQRPKTWHVDDGRLVPKAEYVAMPATLKARVSRAPLTADEIKTLIDSAVDLHSRALESQKEKRWLRPLVVGGIGGILGAAIGPILMKLLGLK